MQKNWFKIDEQAVKDMGEMYSEIERTNVSQQHHLQRLNDLGQTIERRTGYPKGLLEKTEEKVGKLF